MADNQEELLKRTFRELQDAGLISPVRRLKPFKHGPKDRPEFRAGLVRRTRIYYWLDGSMFEANGLRFVLLHEERHLMGYLSVVAYYFSLGVWSSFFVYLLLIGHLQRPPWSLLCLLLPVATWYSAMPFAMIDEIRSDLWASTQLKIKFGIPRPSEIVAKAMDFPPRQMDRSDRIQMHLREMLHVDYHPTKKKRIELIARKVDNLSRDETG